MQYLYIIGSFLLFAVLGKPYPAAEQAEGFHPFYVSVTELRENRKDQIMEVSCRIFSDDFEHTLRMHYNEKIDLINPPSRDAMNRLISDYIPKHLKISFDGKPQKLTFIGYMQNEEAMECFFQINQPVIQKNVTVTNDILFEYKKEQINIVHVTVRDKRKSSQLVVGDFTRSFVF